MRESTWRFNASRIVPPVKSDRLLGNPMSLYTGEDRPRRIVMFGTGAGADTARRHFERDLRHQIARLPCRSRISYRIHFNGRPVVAVDDAIAAFPPDEVLGLCRWARRASTCCAPRNTSS